MSALTFDKKRIGKPGVLAPAGDARYGPYRRLHEYHHRLLQHPPIPRIDGRPHRRQRQDLRPAVVARRDGHPARPDVQPGPAPLPGSVRTARTQVYHGLRIHADPDDHLPRGRRDPPQGDAVDPQADAVDDTLHARGRPLRDPAAAAPVPRLPRQTRADARQHGGRRALLPRGERREVPPLRLVPVALPPDQQTRHGIRSGPRLVLQLRIPAGPRPRLRGARGPDDHGLLRNGAEEGRKHHLLGLARRDGFDEDHRGGIRRLDRTPHAQDRLPEPASSTRRASS